jgi:hypothetical protein
MPVSQNRYRLGHEMYEKERKLYLVIIEYILKVKILKKLFIL